MSDRRQSEGSFAGPSRVLFRPRHNPGTPAYVVVGHASRVPPCLDVYALARVRSKDVMSNFLSSYVDLDEPGVGPGLELTVLPPGFDGHEHDLPLEDWLDLPVSTLDEAVAHGMNDQARAYRLYLRARQPWCGALLAFTVDGGLIYGVSVDDPFDEPEALAEATNLMRELLITTESERAWIVWEDPPPLAPERDRPWETALASSTT